MAAITATQMAERARRQAAGDRGEAQSGILLSAASRLIPNAMALLAEEAAMDSARLPNFIKAFSVTLTLGVADLSGAGYDQLLRNVLRYSVAFDTNEDPDKLSPLIFKPNWRDLYGKLNTNFGYYAVRDNTLITRHKSDGSLTATQGPLSLYAIYVPDFSGSYALPSEEEEAAIDLLARLVLAEIIPASAT